MEWSKLLSYRRLSETEPRDYDAARPPWEIDYDRLVFSSAFRRLQDKTQVHPLSASDYVRTRLTHSLEVSSVARSLGTLAGNHILQRHKGARYGGKTLETALSPSDIGMITSAAALAHDIGNPPFGHSGEDAIRYWFASSPIARKARRNLTKPQRADIENWEGNAAGFRILTRLQFYRNKGGMKLTTACLGAFMKYPTGAAGVVSKDDAKNDVAGKKPGFLESDRQQWEEVANDLGLLKTSTDRWCRHPLAYLTEAADDICYRIVDLEDGFRLRRVPFRDFEELMNELLNEDERKNIHEYSTESEKVAYLRAKAIGKSIKEAADLFCDLEQSLLAGKANGELLDSVPSAGALKAIKDFTKQHVYSMPTVLQIESAGFEIIPGLLDVFVDACDKCAKGNPPSNRSLFARKLINLVPDDFLGPDRIPLEDPYERLLASVDFVAGMTDTFALDLFRKIRGVTIPT